MGPRDAYVLRTVEERGVRFVRLWFVDVLGILKSLAIPVSELEPALDEGVGLDGSAMEGAARARERDVIAYPEPGTFGLLPWRDGDVGRMFCTLRRPDGEPYAADSRAALAASSASPPTSDGPPRSAPRSSSSCSPTTPTRSCRDRSTRARTSTSRRSTRDPTSAAARSTTSSTWASP